MCVLTSLQYSKLHYLLIKLIYHFIKAQVKIQEDLLKTYNIYNIVNFIFHVLVTDVKVLNTHTHALVYYHKKPISSLIVHFHTLFSQLILIIQSTNVFYRGQTNFWQLLLSTDTLLQSTDSSQNSVSSQPTTSPSRLSCLNRHLSVD